jgi:mannose-6-phosphate isomerase-like protein (cupin superfamily)
VDAFGQIPTEIVHSAGVAGGNVRPMSGYTVISLEDAPDVLGDYPGEMRFLKGPLEAEQTALTYRRMPPGTGGRGGYGHRHRTQEEIYLVLDGRLTFKLDDEIVDAGPGTVARVAPATVRSVHNDGDADAILVIASTRLPGDPDDAEIVAGFWPDES